MVKVSRARGVALREAVLDATVAEVAEVGPAVLSIHRVAGRAGVATSVVYNRFSTRERLLTEMIDERLVPRIVAPGRRTEPETTQAWYQVLVAAAWPGPVSDTAREVLIHDPGTLVLTAAEIGSWLLARGLARRAPPASKRRPLVDLAMGHTPDPAGADPRTRATTTTLPRVPAPSPRIPLDALGRALLDATGTAVLDEGFAAATVGGIARRAGTSTGAIYNRFSGKDGLLAEARRHVDDSESPEPTVREPSPTVRAVRVAALHAAAHGAEVAATVAATEGRDLLQRTRDLAISQRDGRVRPDVDPSAAAWVVTALDLGGWLLERVIGDAAPQRAVTTLHQAIRTDPSDVRTTATTRGKESAATTRE